MAKLRFNERKATEAAALLLKLQGGPIYILTLVKLLYFADREALLRWGRPITTDQYVSMDNGPVVSRILNLINDGNGPGDEAYWDSYISPRENHKVSLLAEPPEEELSPAEDQLLREIFQKYGSINRWDLVEIAHQFPEWRDPHGSALPISYGDILRAGMSETDAAEFERELESLSAAEEILTPA